MNKKLMIFFVFTTSGLCGSRLEKRPKNLDEIELTKNFVDDHRQLTGSFSSDRFTPKTPTTPLTPDNLAFAENMQYIANSRGEKTTLEFEVFVIVSAILELRVEEKKSYKKLLAEFKRSKKLIEKQEWITKQEKMKQKKKQ